MAQKRGVIVTDALHRGVHKVLCAGGHEHRFIMRRTFVDRVLPWLDEARKLRRADPRLRDIFAEYPHDIERELAGNVAPLFITIAEWLFDAGWPPSWIEPMREAFGDVVAPPTAKTNIAFGAVEFVYARFDPEIQTLSGHILRHSGETYQRAVNDFRDGFGLSRDFKLTQAIESKLRVRADAVARKAAATYNTRLAAIVKKLRPDMQTKAELEAATMEWAGLYAEQQAVTIARTEVATTQALAVMDAAQAMGVEEKGEWWFYGSLKCPICIMINADCPHTYSDAMGIGIPHPRCGDSWHFHAAPSVTPERDWTGDMTKML